MSSIFNVWFNYINDLNINYDEKNHYLVQEYEQKECTPYNFYQCNLEEEYDLYENKLKNISIQLKEYSNYLTLQYICDKKEYFYSEKIFI